MNPALIASAVALIWLYLRNSGNAKTLPKISYNYGAQPGINAIAQPTNATGNSNANITNQPGTGQSGVPSFAPQATTFYTQYPGLPVSPSFHASSPYGGNRYQVLDAVSAPQPTRSQNTPSGCGCQSCGHMDGCGTCVKAPSGKTYAPTPKVQFAMMSSQAAFALNQYHDMSQQEENGDVPAAPSYH